jgi:hypothetical protein
MKMRALSLALSACAIAGVAHAEPGAVSGVSGAGVTEGETKIEFRTVAFEGEALDGAWNHRAQVGHGFTDWWRGTLILRASQPDDESAELTSIGFENVFEFTATQDWPMQLAGLFEYKHGLNDREDEVEFKLLAERSMGDFNLRINLNAARELSDDADWEPAYAARGMWRASEQFALGVEVFGEPEVNAHYIGPRATMRVGDATFALGYLAGYDDALADSQIRLGLEFTRK